MLESYTSSIGNAAEILTGERLSVRGKTRGSATPSARSHIRAEMKLRKRNRRITVWAMANGLVDVTVKSNQYIKMVGQKYSRPNTA